jgi:cyanoexosortase A
MDWVERLREPKYWLLGITAAVAALHLTLINHANNQELFATAALFWLVAGSLLWDKQETLKLISSPIASLVGAALVAFFLFRSASPSDSELILSGLPFLAVLGVALLASGFTGLRQYWRELLIFGLLAFNPVVKLILNAINLPLLTAKAATFLLWYSGFQVRREELFLLLPTGRVEVYGACSGVQSILQMLNIGVLFLLMVPTPLRWGQKILCLVMAVLVGFIVNALRVALMAILVAFSQKGAFQFWHDGQGSLIFSVISVLVFGGLCWLAFLRTSPNKSDPGAPANA